eukprot:9668644-Karenia_brevis.AAC.1
MDLLMPQTAANLGSDEWQRKRIVMMPVPTPKTSSSLIMHATVIKKVVRLGYIRIPVVKTSPNLTTSTHHSSLAAEPAPPP